MAPNMPQPFPPPTPLNSSPGQVASIPQNTQLQPDLTGQSYVGGGLPTIRVMPASANANASINSIVQTVSQNVTNVVIPTIPPPSFSTITTGQNLQALMLVGTGAFLGYANYFVNGARVGATPFLQGEPVTQSVSGATSVVAAFFNGQIQLGPILGVPNTTGAWVGQVTGAIYAPTAIPTPSTGTVNASEIGTITVSGSVPAHAGQLLISQPGNTSAVWADPQVQGLYASGSSIASPPAYTAPTTICPVFVGGSKSGILQPLLLDASGFLEVSIGGGTTVAVQGTLTNNNAAPSTNNLGVLGMVANAADPTWTEGDMVVGSATLAGYQRVILHAETTKVIGTVNQGTSPWTDNLTQVASTVLGVPQTFGTAPTGVVIGTSADVYYAGTRARSNQTTTAAGVQDVNIVGALGVTNSVSNGVFMAITDNTTKAGVIAATTALKTDQSSQAGTAVTTVPVAFGSGTPSGNAPGVNAAIFVGTTAVRSNQTTSATGVVDVNIVGALGSTISATKTLFDQISDGAAVMGAMANFGTSPGAVKALNDNASIFSGTTALTNTAGALDINLKSITTVTDLPVNIDKFGGVSVSLGNTVSASSMPVTVASDELVTLGQSTMSASVPVTMASDQTPLQVSATTAVNSAGNPLFVQTVPASVGSVGTVGAAVPSAATLLGYNQSNLTFGVSKPFPLPVQIISNDDPFVVSGQTDTGDAQPLLVDIDGKVLISEDSEFRLNDGFGLPLKAVRQWDGANALRIAIAPSQYPFSAAVTTAVMVKPVTAGALTVSKLVLLNTTAAIAYVQFFDAKTVGAVTLGTTAPSWVIGLPANSTTGAGLALVDLDTLHYLGLVMACTTTPTGNSTASVFCTVWVN